jgi:hypothetical protein
MSLTAVLVPLADKIPADKDVKAGWVAFVVFIGLCLAVAFLGYSLTKHLKRARTNADHGMFDPSDKPSKSS